MNEIQITDHSNILIITDSYKQQKEMISTGFSVNCNTFSDGGDTPN
jgi:hypothetical protein